MIKVWLKNASRWVFAIFVMVGFVILQSQGESTEIGKNVTDDIKAILKPSFMEILASSEIVSWDEFKTRFQRIKEATANFETKYKNQLTGSALDIAAQVAASVPSPAQVQAIQPAVQVTIAPADMQQQAVGMQAPAPIDMGQMAAAPQPLSNNFGQVAIAAPAIIPAPAQDLSQIQNTAVMTAPVQIQVPQPSLVPSYGGQAAPQPLPSNVGQAVAPAAPVVQVTVAPAPVVPVVQAPIIPVTPAPVVQAPALVAPVVPVIQAPVLVAPVAQVVPDVQAPIVAPAPETPAIEVPAPVTSAPAAPTDFFSQTPTTQVVVGDVTNQPAPLPNNGGQDAPAPAPAPVPAPDVTPAPMTSDQTPDTSLAILNSSTLPVAPTPGM